MNQRHTIRHRPLLADAILCICVVTIVGMCFFICNYHPDFVNAGGTVDSFLSAENRGQSPLWSFSSSSSAIIASSSQTGQKVFRQSKDWRLVLANSKVMLPSGYQPQIMSYDSVQMDKRIEPDYLAMKAAAQKDGISLWLSGGYRSVDAQKKLFQNEVQKYLSQGMKQAVAEEAAQKHVSRPGCSEHNTGLTLDFNGSKDSFTTTEAYAWLQKHAADYGFILRYPKDKETITGIEFEPWCYRYVGKENAAVMSKRHVCLEEYLNSLL